MEILTKLGDPLSGIAQVPRLRSRIITLSFFLITLTAMLAWIGILLILPFYALSWMLPGLGL